MTMSDSPTHCVHFDVRELSDATNGFDKTPAERGGCKLGEGGFGTVFQGELNFTDVAIKIARVPPKGDKEAERQTSEQFETELKVLSKFRHPNLVTLIGYCSSPKCLIYEFMPNGSLEDALEIGLRNYSSAQHGKGIHLPWMCRLSIAMDTARGLAYLHNVDKKNRIVHRNVKSAAVLLDLSFRAKVGGLGIACSLDEGSDVKKTTRVIGTSGYLSPEYYRGIITTKLDAFGFGVILLELITGFPSYDSRRSPKDLISYMERDMDLGLSGQTGLLCTKVDMHAGDWPSQSFVNLFRIADECLKPKMKERAEMVEVYPKLRKLMTDSTEWYSQQELYKTKKTAT